MTPSAAPLTRRPVSRRRVLLNVAHVVFLVTAVVFAGVSLRNQWSDIARDVAHITVWEWMVSLLAIYFGLLVFGLMWLRVLAGFGYRLHPIKGLGIFFVGQLGRYIPGSVWSFGAQATMARAVKVPPRVTVVAGLIGLGFSLATAGVVGLIAVAVGVLPVAIPAWIAVTLSVLVVGVLLSPLINFIGTRVAGKAETLTLRVRDVLVIIALLAVTWLMDGVALMVLSGGFDRPEFHWGEQLWLMIGAYALSYVVGVVIIFAPAGLGAREAAVTFLLAPAIGVPAAAALALVSRLPMVIADFSLALVFWSLRNRGKTSG